MGSYTPPSRQKRFCENYLEFFCLRVFSLLPHLFIYSVIYFYHFGRVNIYFILWIMFQHYFIVLWPLGTLSVNSYVPVAYSHQCRLSGVLISIFLLSGTRCSFHLVYSCPRGRFSHSSKQLWFLFLEDGVRNQDLGAHLVLGCNCFQALLNWQQGSVCVC